jgi:hypothetical protein
VFSGSSLTTALLLIDDRGRCKNEVDTTGAAVGPCSGCRGYLTVELVLSAELIKELVRTLAMRVVGCYTGGKRPPLGAMGCSRLLVLLEMVFSALEGFMNLRSRILT